MKEKIFNYNGHEFEPIGNILGGWVAKANCLYYGTNDKSILTVNHDDFYKVAKKNKASCDVYKIDGGILVMSANGNFRPVKINNAKFKKCEDYEYWYK